MVAAALLRAARDWTADPANDEKKRQLIAQARNVGQRLGGPSGRLAAAIVGRLEGRRTAPASWEREAVRLRGHVVGVPSGPERARLFDAYVDLLARGPARDETPARARTACEREAQAVATDPLGPRERERALETLRRVRAHLPHD